MLAKASYSENDIRILSSNIKSQIQFESSVHPDICKKAIEELGIDHEIVLKRFFECSYTTSVLLWNPFQLEDRKQIAFNTAMMKEEYPGHDYITAKNFEENYLPSLLST